MSKITYALMVVGLGCIAALAISLPRFTKSESSNSPEAVVRSYISDSEQGTRGNFAATAENENLECDQARAIAKENQVLPTVTVRESNPDLPECPRQVYLRWVQSEFPAMIQGSKLRLKSVENVEISGDRATVGVLFENDGNYTQLPFTFLLLKRSDYWKIVGITTSEKGRAFMAN